MAAVVAPAMSHDVVFTVVPADSTPERNDTEELIKDLVSRLDSPDLAEARKAFDMIYDMHNYKYLYNALNVEKNGRWHAQLVDDANRLEAATLKYTNILEILPRYYSREHAAMVSVINENIYPEDFKEAISQTNKDTRKISTSISGSIKLLGKIVDLNNNLADAKNGVVSSVKIWPEGQVDEVYKRDRLNELRMRRMRAGCYDSCC